MTTAEKLQEAYENSERVKELNSELESILYGADTGGQSWYDKFWDAYQQNGEREYYYYAFAYQWNDECYNPKYPIICGTNSSDGQNIFRSSTITDTKVPIHILANGQAAFYSAARLKTIRKLVVTENTSYVNMFYGTGSIENITVEGVIGKDFAMSGCSKLTHDSVMSVINALKDFSETTTTRTLDLHTNTVALLSEEEKAIVTNKGWTLA